MPKKKIVIEPAGKDLNEFKGRYADSWRTFVNSPAGQSGLQFLRNRKLEQVALLTEEAIEKNSREYISNLQGYLQHENELLSLSEMTDFTLPFEETDEYISPEQEVEREQLQAKFREENKRQRYAH